MDWDALNKANARKAADQEKLFNEREEHKAHLKWEEGNLYNSALDYFC